MSEQTISKPMTPAFVRPLTVLICDALIAMVALGMRHSFGLFLDPITRGLPSIDREAFGFAVALQNPTWDLAQSRSPAESSRKSSPRAIWRRWSASSF
jgi:hypothetical protein